MKNRIQTILFLALIAVFFSCQTNTKQDSENEAPEAVLPTEPETKAQQTICYQSTENASAQHSLELTYDGDQVTGYLTLYNPNAHSVTGQFKGTKKGNLIFAEYRHFIEGAEGISEVSFKIDGENIYQGSGEMTESGDRLIFKDKSNIQYNQLLTSTDCEQIAEHIQWSKEVLVE